MAISVPAGTVTPLENVNGRNTRRAEDSGKTQREDQCLISGELGKELNEPNIMPSNRCVSRRKLSILCILSIPSFVQPSSLITASTSCRRGSIYSGWARRRYNTCIIVYRVSTRSDQDRTTCGDGMPSLAKDVVCTATKFIKSIRRAKLSTDISTFWVSLMTHMSTSFCGSVM